MLGLLKALLSFVFRVSLVCGSIKAHVPHRMEVELMNESLLRQLVKGSLKAHALESIADTPSIAVATRRAFYQRTIPSVRSIPFDPETYAFDPVVNKNCENVVGTVSIPVGMVGPFVVDGLEHSVPLATTEGALVASLNRGAKAMVGGVHTVVTDRGISRAPLVRCDSIEQVRCIEAWIQHNWGRCCEGYASTTNHGSLDGFQMHQSGRYAHLRFNALTGNAMGMNGISKGVQRVMDLIETQFPSIEVLSMSGNTCTDKKTSAMNWINGRGKKVVVETTIPKAELEKTLKVDVETFLTLHQQKNLVGSALAGTIGGCNAHAANAIAAIFIATGQDPAQIGTSSFSITSAEATPQGDLLFGITLPCLEVATIGGGTGLAHQRSILECMGLRGDEVGSSSRLAGLCGVVALAGELSLLAAHASNDLVRAHMKLGRGS